MKKEDALKTITMTLEEQEYVIKNSVSLSEAARKILGNASTQSRTIINKYAYTQVNKHISSAHRIKYDAGNNYYKFSYNWINLVRQEIEQYCNWQEKQSSNNSLSFSNLERKSLALFKSF